MRRRVLTMLAIFAGAFGAGLVVAALSGDGEPADLPRAERRGRAITPVPPPPPAPAPPRPRAAPVPAAVRALAARMPRAQQVAQLFVVGFEGSRPADPFFARLPERTWGAVVLTEANASSPDEAAVLAGEVAVVARNAQQVVPLVATDGIPGLEPRPQSPADRPAAVRAAARAEAQRLRQAGVTLVLAPRLDVGIEASEGTFGDDPHAVARLGAAAVAGYRAGGVVPAPGYFPGQGAATQDPLDGPASVGLSRQELRARDLLPFAAVARRAPAVVLSSAAFAAFDPAAPAALTPAVLRELRGLGFTGVAMTDDLAGVTAATGGTPGEAAVAALRAGADMVRVTEPADARAAYAAALQAVASGDIPAARLRQALHRVLAMKRAAKL